MRPISSFLISGLALATASSCQKVAPTLEPGIQPVQTVPPVGAQASGTGVQAALHFSATREAIAPLELANPVDLQLMPGQPVTRSFKIPRSTQGLWARATSTPATVLQIGGKSVSVGAASLIYLPVVDGSAAVTSTLAAHVTIDPVATVDSAGGGFVVTDEATSTFTFAEGESRRVDDPGVGPVDDTFGRLVTLELTGTVAGKLQLGHCAATGALPINVEALLDVDVNGAVSTNLWLPAGAVCLNASAALQLRMTTVGRVRRFGTTSLRAADPLVVLDTVTGEGGWKGQPTSDQRLAIDLHGVSGDRPFTKVLISASVSGGTSNTVGLARCGSPDVAWASGSVQLVSTADSWCVSAHGGQDVKVSVLGVVTERSEATGVCPARPGPAACAATDILGRLNCIPGVRAENSLERAPLGTQRFQLYITQPVDHFRPEGATFEQRVLLTYRNTNAPVVLHTTGYELFVYLSDVSYFFPVNELEVEHRFFESSTPGSLDYSTLTIMQSAYDSHRIVELLNPLFHSPWLNTGHSKGGMTALYHRRYFPCDVDASAPYVTPLSLGREDARYGTWMADIGGPQYASCRAAVQKLERGVIAGKAIFAPQLPGTYQLVGSPENALYMLCDNALWGAFQYGQQDDQRSGCPPYEAGANSADFPDVVATYASYGESYNDDSIAQYPLDPYSYQTQNELGDPGAYRDHLLEYGPIPTMPDWYELIFGTVPHVPFEPRAMQDVQQWLLAQGDHFQFIYGGWDPWSGGQVAISGQRDTYKIMVPAMHHGVSLEDLPEPEREQTFQRLESWLGVRRLDHPVGHATAQRPTRYRDVMHRHRL